MWCDRTGGLAYASSPLGHKMPHTGWFLQECPAAHECSESSWAKQKSCQSFIHKEACLEHFKDHLRQSSLHYQNSDEKVAEYMDKAASMVRTEQVPDHWFEPRKGSAKKRKCEPPTTTLTTASTSGELAVAGRASSSVPAIGAPAIEVPVIAAPSEIFCKVPKAKLDDLVAKLSNKRDTLKNAHRFFVQAASVLEKEAEEMNSTIKMVQNLMTSPNVDVD